MRFIAVDPGPTESAFVVFRDGEMVDFGKVSTDEMLDILKSVAFWLGTKCVIEMIASYGMAVGAEVFETCVNVGRFMQAFGVERCTRITRIQIKNHICHSPRANDSNIRQAIIDRYGGKEKAIGKKHSKGPLYGVSADVWAALAVALTYMDQHYGTAPV
jgi:hypothetical protein